MIVYSYHMPYKGESSCKWELTDLTNMFSSHLYSSESERLINNFYKEPHLYNTQALRYGYFFKGGGIGGRLL